MPNLKQLLLAVGLCTPAVAHAQQDAPVAAQASTERRGWFGISLTCSECYIQRGPGRVAYTQAPAISSVESGSPAHQAGLRNGDTIIAVEGQLLTTPEGFERFATARGGVPIRLTVRKAGEPQREVTVVPSERHSNTTVADFYNERLRTAQRVGFNALRSGFRTPLGWLGLSVECEGCSMSNASRRLQANFRNWPVVDMVDVDGPAHRGGLRRGDTLVAIDGIDLATSAGGRAFSNIEPDQRVMMTVRRGGTERRMPLTAIARPDATPQELSSFNEYKRMRDSTDAQYRQVLGAHVAQASVEIRELERMLREMETSRSSVEESRRRLSTIDSILRSLRRAESERTRLLGSSATTVYGPGSMVYAPVAPIPPVAPTPGVAPMPTPVPGQQPIYPVRYSNRFRNLVNVEARAPGGVSVTEEGDSVVVLYMPGGASVRVAVRR